MKGMCYFKDHKYLQIDFLTCDLCSGISAHRKRVCLCGKGTPISGSQWSGKLETFVWLHSYLPPRNDLQTNEIMSEKHSELLRERNKINARYHHYSHCVQLNFHILGKWLDCVFLPSSPFPKWPGPWFLYVLGVYCSLWPHCTFIILTETKCTLLSNLS